MLAEVKPYNFLQVHSHIEMGLPILLSRLKCLIIESVSPLFEALFVGCILHINTSIHSGIDWVMS